MMTWHLYTCKFSPTQKASAAIKKGGYQQPSNCTARQHPECRSERKGCFHWPSFSISSVTELGDTFPEGSEGQPDQLYTRTRTSNTNNAQNEFFSFLGPSLNPHMVKDTIYCGIYQADASERSEVILERFFVVTGIAAKEEPLMACSTTISGDIRRNERGTSPLATLPIVSSDTLITSHAARVDSSVSSL
jgi:hypothetical protein